MSWLRMLLLLMCVLGSVSTQSFAQTPIRIGIAPHSSPRILFESHIHVKMFFEAYFKRDVELVTAKSFQEFSKKAHEGDTYDMIITSSHLALLAHKRASYRPLMSYTHGIEVVILARTKEVMTTAKRPLNVFAQGSISLSTLLAQEWLLAQGLEEGKDVVYDYDVSASDTLALLLARHEADMVVMSLPNYRKLRNEEKEPLFVVFQSPSLPYNRTYAVKEGNGITLGEWDAALKAFSMSSYGKDHLEVVKLGAFKSVSLDDLNGLESIAHTTLKRINP